MDAIDKTTTDYKLNQEANHLFQVAQEILVAKPKKAEVLLVKGNRTIISMFIDIGVKIHQPIQEYLIHFII